MLVGEEMSQKTFVTLFRPSFPFASTSQTTLQSVIDDQTYANVLSQYSIRDRTRLLALSDSSGLACAWLRALPSPKLGLALSPAEFVVAVRIWLGIPVFSEADSVLCSCHQLVDRFGDHRRHNALCDIIYYALLEDSADVRREQGVSRESASRPGDVFHPDFHNGHPTYFDISVRSAVHSGVITHSASSPGFAALKGEMEKDARHRDLVEAAGGVFFPLVVDNFGVWTPSSIEVLRSIAHSSTVHNGLSVGTAFHHLMERLSVQLYRYNARMILQFWALHPHLEDDWLDACTRWEVGCLESCQSCGNNEDEGHKDSGSASPLKDPCTSVLSDVSYGVAVCNRFACLLVEPTPDDDCADPNDRPDPSSDSGSVSSSHGSLPAVLLVSKAENSGDLRLSHRSSSSTNDANSGDCETVAPSDGLRDLIYFTFNNLSSCNLPSMVEQFSESVEDIYLPWVAVYLVERASIELNLHALYLRFLDHLADSSLYSLTLMESSDVLVLLSMQTCHLTSPSSGPF